VGAGYLDKFTNEKGEATIGEFKPGCCGNCWKGGKEVVEIPDGYKPTTPTEILFNGPDGTMVAWATPVLR
jgi:hypothetical protein